MTPDVGILRATHDYESWLRSNTKVIESELSSTHAQMRQDPFMFFRGTYYRWTQLWPLVCADLCHSVKVLAVGDLHVGSFGTWRDREGRLCWGVDDFDDAYPLPYTNDLVRLAASVKMVTDADGLTIKYRDGCDAILEGYRESLGKGGCPIVLAERQVNLEKLGIAAFDPPDDFWRKLNKSPAIKLDNVPAGAKRALRSELPPKIPFKVARREAGLGSLGQQRFVAIANYEGGCIAREAKATVPSASVWKDGNSAKGERYYERLISSAIRSHDPYQAMHGSWLIRRLSPDSDPIEIETLPKERDEHLLLRAMGAETANVHLGTKNKAHAILEDLRGRKRNWLRRAGKKIAKVFESEWNEYR